MKIIGLSCSPRHNSNSENLLLQFLSGAQEAGGSTQHYALKKMSFSLCVGCESCATTGFCRFKDDLTLFFQELAQADALVLAAPVFSLGLNALAKGMVDRTQVYWYKKYVRKEEDPLTNKHLCGYFISTAGFHNDAVFACSLKTVKYFYDVLKMRDCGQTLIHSVDHPGDILQRKDLLLNMKEQGADFVRRMLVQG